MENTNFEKKMRQLSPSFPEKLDTVQMNGQDWQVIKINDRAVQYTLVEKIISDSQNQPQPTIDYLIQDDYKINKTPELLTVDVVLSREGVYPYPERSRTEAKLAPDLRLAARFKSTITAFDRHPRKGERGISTYLGEVRNITFDNKINAIKGKDYLWREIIEPYDTLNDAILNKKKFAVSVGQYNTSGPPGTLHGAKYQASQENILLDHLAHLVDGSIPRCAVGKCGFEVEGLSNDTLNILSKLVEDEQKALCPLNNKDAVKMIQKLL